MSPQPADRTIDAGGGDAVSLIEASHNRRFKCFENGLLLLSGGDSTIRFCPPLITTSEQIEVGLEIFLVFITGTAA